MKVNLALSSCMFSPTNRVDDDEEVTLVEGCCDALKWSSSALKHSIGRGGGKRGLLIAEIWMLVVSWFGSRYGLL